MSRVRSSQRVWRMDDFFGPIRGEKIRFFTNLKNHPGTLEALEKTHLDLWKNTGPSRAKLHVTRRAVVSRVIRVQRRYTVRSRPWNRWPGLTLDRFLNYLLSGTESVPIFPT